MVFLFSFFIEWDIDRVKRWALTVFDDEEVAGKFENEEIDGKTLQSDNSYRPVKEQLGISNNWGKNGFSLQSGNFPVNFNP